MIIRCPSCRHIYDGSGYPEDYAFQCSCGVSLKLSELLKQDSVPIEQATELQLKGLPASSRSAQAMSEQITERIRPPHEKLPSHIEREELSTERVKISQASEEDEVETLKHSEDEDSTRDLLLSQLSEDELFDIEHSEKTARVMSPYLISEGSEADGESEFEEEGNEATVRVFNPLLQEQQRVSTSHAEVEGGSRASDFFPAEEDLSTSEQPGLAQPFIPQVPIEKLEAAELGKSTKERTDPSQEPSISSSSPLVEAHSTSTFSSSQQKAEMFIPMRTEPRAIVAFLLLFLLMLGPLVVMLAWSARYRINEHYEVLRGRGLASLSLFLGLFQSFGLFFLLSLFLLYPEHSFTQKLISYWPFMPESMAISKLRNKPKQNEKLLQRHARSILLEDFKRRGKKESELGKVAVIQGPKKRFAYAHWYDNAGQRAYRSLLYYSNRGHWHLAMLEAGTIFETRCGASGTKRLNQENAKSLLQCFWKLRGRFSNVKVTKIHIFQDPGSLRAYAYWLLQKELKGGVAKNWFIKSSFDYANNGQWYLSRYASKVRGVRALYEEKGGKRLSSSIALKLLKTSFLAESKSISISSLYVFQKEKAREASAIWFSSRKRTIFRGVFQYANDSHWFLTSIVAVKTISRMLAVAGSARLSRTIGRHLFRSSLRSKRIKKLIDSFYIYQPLGSNRAHIRGLLHPRRKGNSFEVIAKRSERGYWVVTKDARKFEGEVFRFRRGKSILSRKVATFLLKQHWKEESIFTGMRLGSIYIFQNTKNHFADAHWSGLQGGQKSLMRSRFFFSQKNRWFLGEYDLKNGFFVAFRSKSGTILTTEVAETVLNTHQEQNKRVEGQDIEKRVVHYVYQEPNTKKAFVQWMQKRKNRYIVMLSVFHRSQLGEWCLSTQEKWFLSRKLLPHVRTIR